MTLAILDTDDFDWHCIAEDGKTHPQVLFLGKAMRSYSYDKELARLCQGAQGAVLVSLSLEISGLVLKVMGSSYDSDIILR